MTNAGKYISRPIGIEAMQYTGDNGEQIERWVQSYGRAKDYSDCGFMARELNPEWNPSGDLWDGTITAAVWDRLHKTWVGVKTGQWIARGMKGEFYPIDPEVFEAKYQQAPDVDPLSMYRDTSDHPELPNAAVLPYLQDNSIVIGCLGEGCRWEQSYVGAVKMDQLAQEWFTHVAEEHGDGVLNGW